MSLSPTGTEPMSRGDSALQSVLRTAIDRGERGVQVAAYLGDELIIDGWIGQANSRGTAVTGSTLFPIFSVTKGLTATAIHLQAERGLLDYESPAAAYWPEFKANGKQDITVRHLLTHQSGLPQMPAGVTPERLQDWEWCVENIAALEPILPAGSSAYASLSYGWLLGELVRRTDPAHRGFAQFTREDILEPLGIGDFYVGMNGRQHERVAELVTTSTLRADPPPLRELAMPPAVEPGVLWNNPVLYDAVIPGAGGIANARSVARLFAMLAGKGTFGGRRILSEDRVMACTEPRPNSGQLDPVLDQVPWIGVGGYWLGGPTPPAEPVIGSGVHTLASNGAGGSIAWADLDTGLAVAICHNRMFRISPPLPPDEHPFHEIGEYARSLVG
jgi:CubicO group peptidase (beta-lactamase class C family)